MGHYHDEIRANQEAGRDLRSRIPGTYDGFSQMHKATFADGELSTAFKELIAVAIAVSDRCDGCIAAHTRSAVRAGVTADQFAEMLAVVIDMNGGPGTVYAPKAWEAYQEFEERYG